jgi:glycosyltransferase involved in cell wall biosynthesis
MSAGRPIAIATAPSREAISGVTTHLNLMFGSTLARDFVLLHFQVGSESRKESRAGRIWRLLTGPLMLAARILLADADIVHLNTSLNARAWWRDLSLLLAAKLCGARTIYQIHGGMLPQHFSKALRVPAALVRAVLSLPDAVVVLARCELAAYRAFLPKQRVLALPNAIDSARYRPRRVARPPEAPLRLVSVGRLAPDKGLPELLEGLAMARGRGVDARLAIAGGGPLEGELKTLAAKLGLADVVRFVGPVFDGSKIALLESSDVLALPSHFEGLPYALLEGMAAGLPVIVTRVGAIPDVVDHGVHGLFVPIDSPRAICRAIVRLAGERALLPVMGIAGQQRIAQHYSLERMADDFTRLYRSLCGPAAAASAP